MEEVTVAIIITELAEDLVQEAGLLLAALLLEISVKLA
jgi:hypothetical protein